MAILTTTNEGLNFIGGTTFIQTGTTTLMAIATNGDIQFSQYGAGTLVTDASGNITVSSGGGAGGPYLPLSAGSTVPLSGDLYLNDSKFVRFTTTGGSNGNASIDFSTGAAFSFVSNSSYAPMVFKTSSTERMRILANGNVGIGTTSPTKELDVRDEARIWNGVNGIELSYSNGNTSGIVASANNSGNLEFRTHAGLAAKMFITNAGNVGIGTTSPDSLLHVSADVTGANTGTITIEGRPTGFLGDDIATIDFHNSGNKRADIRMERGNTADDSQLVFSTSDVGTLNDALIINEVGNVGIGVTPRTISNYKVLDISGSGGSGGYIGLSSGSTQQGELYSHGGGVDLVAIGAKQTRFFTNGSQQAVITSSGNVGIGTTSPGANLDVAGTAPVIRITNTTDPLGNGTVGSFEFFTKDSSTGATRTVSSIVCDNQAGSAVPGGDLVFKTSLGGSGSPVATEKVRIQANGNVGIGVTGPVNKLNVNGDIGYIGVIGQGSIYGNTGNSSFSTMQLYDPATGYTTLNNQSYGYYFNTSGGTKVTILNGGNVGIGATGPLYKLQVGGPADAQGFVNDEGGNKNRLLFPKGGSLNLNVTTGAIKVKLPVLWTNTMMRITLRIFDYAQNESFDVTVAGYNYTGSGSGGYWVNTSAWISSQSDIDRNFSVRFGEDGTNSLFYIGELNSSWAYLKVNIVDVELNHAATVANWSTTAWSISMETTAFASVTQTRTNCQVNNWKRSGQNVYYGSGTGNVGIGTTSPAQALDVTGKIRVTDDIILAQQNGRIDYDNGVSTGALRFFSTSGNTERMRITSAGNVGINVTNPNEKLHVDGNIRLDGSVFFSNSSVFNKILLNGTDMEIWSGALFPSIDITSGGLLKFGAYALGGAGTPTKLLGVDGSGNVLTTVSGSSLPGGPYLPLAGGTMTGDLRLNDGIELELGSDQDLRMSHDGSNGYMNNFTGDLYIRNFADNKDIIFQSDDSLGGVETYFYLDGGVNLNYPITQFPISSRINMGEPTLGELELYSDGTNGYIRNRRSGNIVIDSIGDVIIDATNTNTSISEVKIRGRGNTLLQTAGNMIAIGDSQNNDSKLNIRDDGTNGHIAFENSSEVTGIITSGTDFINFRTGDGVSMSDSPVLTLFPSRIGINTTSPNSNVALDIDGRVLIKDSTGVADFYLGNYATANHFRFHTNNADTYFDMNCGNIYWRDGASTRYTFFPSTANMTVNGTITQNSDARVKENIVEIGDCITKVQAMKGVYYNRTDFNTETKKVGVIAQDVEAVLPELIIESPEDGLKSVAYSELTAVLINAIKEQQEIIEDLKTRITKLEN